MVEFSQNLSIQDLRAMTHGLRRTEFTCIDEDAISQIKIKISALPTPEKLAKFCDEPLALRELVRQIGEIMQLIEIYGKMGQEYKSRFISKKKLPPRYKILEWRKKEVSVTPGQIAWQEKGKQFIKEEENMQKAAEVIKTLVKVSAKADEKGLSALSSCSLKLAKDIKNNKFDEKSLLQLSSTLKQSGFSAEAEMVKEAGIGGFLGGLGGGVSNLFKNIWQAGKAGSLEQDFKSTAQKIESIVKKLQDLSNQASKSGDTAMAQRMKHLYDVANNAAKAWNQTVEEGQKTANDTSKPTPPAGAQPAGAQPAGAQPAGTQPAGAQPAGTQPAGAQPASNKTIPPTASAQIKGLLNKGWTKDDIVKYVQSLS
jgi:hypothetical protein